MKSRLPFFTPQILVLVIEYGAFDKILSMKQFRWGSAGIVLSLCATVLTGSGKPDLIILNFTGNPAIACDVRNEALWQVLTSPHLCNGEDKKACALIVDHVYTRLIGVFPNQIRVLDEADITLGAIEGNEEGYYIPEQESGLGFISFIVNRN
jgi:hypothetical protein